LVAAYLANKTCAFNLIIENKETNKKTESNLPDRTNHNLSISEWLFETYN
jgi:hypothetical protein